MCQLILLAATGALGVVARFILSKTTEKIFGNDFPYGTLLVNILGCLLIGLLIILKDVFTRMLMLYCARQNLMPHPLNIGVLLENEFFLV